LCFGTHLKGACFWSWNVQLHLETTQDD
jgi:hypothetical protein